MSGQIHEDMTRNFPNGITREEFDAGLERVSVSISTYLFKNNASPALKNVRVDADCSGVLPHYAVAAWPSVSFQRCRQLCRLY